MNELEALIARIETLTDEEGVQLQTAWKKADDELLYEALAFFYDRPSSQPGWLVAANSTVKAWVRRHGQEPNSALLHGLGAATCTVQAILIRDHIGDKFTQEHYDVLSAPWRTIIGPIHADDQDLRTQQ